MSPRVWRMTEHCRLNAVVKNLEEKVELLERHATESAQDREEERRAAAAEIAGLQDDLRKRDERYAALQAEAAEALAALSAELKASRADGARLRQALEEQALGGPGGARAAAEHAARGARVRRARARRPPRRPGRQRRPRSARAAPAGKLPRSL